MCGVGGINLEKRKIFIEDLIKKRFRYIKKKENFKLGTILCLEVRELYSLYIYFYFFVYFLKSLFVLFCFLFFAHSYMISSIPISRDVKGKGFKDLYYNLYKECVGLGG